jgi:Rad3-related DNA helicase
MSGTTFEMDIAELNIHSYKFKEVESPIPVSQRQVIIDCVASFVYKDREKLAPVMAHKIKSIINENHAGQRGIILVTYAQSKLLEPLLTDPKYRFHTKANKSQVINDFIENTGECQVAVLCGSWEGLDLKNEIASFVIIGALPLPNWGDAVVKRRAELDSLSLKPYHWYEMQALKNIIQGAGRASRNTRDHSTIWIIDSKFTKAYVKVKEKLPKFFKESLVWVKA